MQTSVILLSLSIGLVLGLLSFPAYEILTGTTVTTGVLLTALPGALIGLVTLGYNIFNHVKIQQLQRLTGRRDFIINAFEKYAADPVEEALTLIEDVIDRVEKVYHEKGKGIDTKKVEIGLILEEAYCTIQKAYRLCREADSYLKLRGFTSQFEKTMHFVGEQEKLDDLIITRLSDACAADQNNYAFDAKLGQVNKTMSEQKILIRDAITSISTKIYKQFEN